MPDLINNEALLADVFFDDDEAVRFQALPHAIEERQGIICTES